MAGWQVAFLFLSLLFLHAVHRCQAQQAHTIRNDNACSIVQRHTRLLQLGLATHDLEVFVG